MQTEILATVGPATAHKIQELTHNGISGIRINSSHGKKSEYTQMIDTFRACCPNGYVLFDIKGPKIRLGDFPDPMPVRNGQHITLLVPEENTTQYPCVDDPENGVPVSYAKLDEFVKPGHRLLIDDGYVGLQVEKVQKKRINCRVMYGDQIRSRKGLNHPDTVIDYPYTMPGDVKLIEYAVQKRVDFIADSFTRNAEDVQELRERLVHSGIKIVSKIENPEGISHFDAILQETDAIMIARGDLGVEIDPWKLPELQKKIIEACAQAGKPVVTATQMLESMIDNPHPSRADVSDVANAIYDGTDVVMLSGETSIGKYPVECVRMMKRIGEQVESTERYRRNKTSIHSLTQLLSRG